WILAGHDGILAVDIGGTNIRAGVVELNRRKAENLSAARVSGLELWRHRDDAPDRDDAVDQLAGMLRTLARRAKKDGLRLAPLIGIGCPGLIRDDGSIVKGGQNLPGGDWEMDGFNLPRRIRELVPDIGGHETAVLMHNDAVVQGLSEVPCMRDVERWGVLTIGTGLGNARFTNRTGVSGGGGRDD
ncbi:MAG: ROK family protein, partial [Acetobacteraceae bacterium]|nr:ROK family protein [Acetobacteraceae bacterium]